MLVPGYFTVHLGFLDEFYHKSIFLGWESPYAPAASRRLT